jgi:hypothetical protein
MGDVQDGVLSLLWGLYDKNGWPRSRPPKSEQGVIVTKEMTEAAWEEVRRAVIQLRAGRISRVSAESILRANGVPGAAIPVILMYVPAVAGRSASR